jgi:hypothetical protein
LAKQHFGVSTHDGPEATDAVGCAGDTDSPDDVVANNERESDAWTYSGHPGDLIRAVGGGFARPRDFDRGLVERVEPTRIAASNHDAVWVGDEDAEFGYGGHLLGDFLRE